MYAQIIIVKYFIVHIILCAFINIVYMHNKFYTTNKNQIQKLWKSDMCKKSRIIQENPLSASSGSDDVFYAGL